MFDICTSVMGSIIKFGTVSLPYISNSLATYLYSSPVSHKCIQRFMSDHDTDKRAWIMSLAIPRSRR
jgi:hypothetical protein